MRIRTGGVSMQSKDWHGMACMGTDHIRSESDGRLMVRTETECMPLQIALSIFLVYACAT